MRETLGLLAVSGLETLLAGSPPPESIILTYQDFSLLRPRYADSTWRVTLGKLVDRRLVLKTYREGLTAFQLAKQGWEEYRALSPLFSVRADQEWLLALYTPSGTGKLAAGQARRLFEQAGYQLLQSGVALKPQSAYSDYLPQELRRLGYSSVFIPLQAGLAKPIPIGELWLSHDRLLRTSKECEKISKEVNELLMQLSEKKRLKNQTKERIGSALVSGLNFISSLNWLDLEDGQGGKPVRQLARDMDSLMRQYAENNPAWRG